MFSLFHLFKVFHLYIMEFSLYIVIFLLFMQNIIDNTIIKSRIFTATLLFAGIFLKNLLGEFQALKLSFNKLAKDMEMPVKGPYTWSNVIDLIREDLGGAESLSIIGVAPYGFIVELFDEQIKQLLSEGKPVCIAYLDPQKEELFNLIENYVENQSQHAKHLEDHLNHHYHSYTSLTIMKLDFIPPVILTKIVKKNQVVYYVSLNFYHVVEGRDNRPLFILKENENIRNFQTFVESNALKGCFKQTNPHDTADRMEV